MWSPLTPVEAATPRRGPYPVPAEPTLSRPHRADTGLPFQGCALLGSSSPSLVAAGTHPTA